MIRRSICECACHTNQRKVKHAIACCRPDSLDEICDDLYDIVHKDDLEHFKDFPKDKLVEYHHGFGTVIRNKYRLWEDSWEPEVKDGVDYSPNHPDAKSLKIMEEFHRKLNAKDRSAYWIKKRLEKDTNE